VSRPPTGHPKQIRYIIGNEGCERFSFYGMKNILTFFMVNYMLLSEPTAKANYHLFISACYFFPLLGGILADRFLGKYQTIFWLSLLYCVGHGCLAVFEGYPPGFYLGLALIALGSGGIKPCVSAMVGDQYNESNKHLVKQVFALFYWIINFGSFFASALIPKTLAWFGPSVAFGIPGVLMAIATLVLWLGRDKYVHIPPTRRSPHAFSRVVLDALRSPARARREPNGASSGHWLDRARDRHPESAVEGAKAVFRVMMIFATIPIFWALFDQKGSTWILQAQRMDPMVGPWRLEPSQLMALNPLMVMILIPFNGWVLFPLIERRLGFELTPLRRMTIGMFIAGSSFASVAILETVLVGGVMLSMLWQTVPYLLITLSEVFVSTTGLEFAYSQAPREMKSTIMSFWNLTVTVGNLLAASISALNVFTGPSQYWFWAILVFLAAIGFALLARRYVVVDFFQKAEAAPSDQPSAGEVRAAGNIKG
jgi:proton-dependent oligopeptide transporter, POT family